VVKLTNDSSLGRGNLNVLFVGYVNTCNHLYPAYNILDVSESYFVCMSDVVVSATGPPNIFISASEREGRMRKPM
jgi:hypothetical protein